MPKIIDLKAYWILDSRGIPTVQCEISVENLGKTFVSKASVPSGASTGTHEALELRDGGKDFFGKGVHKAVENINQTIKKNIVDVEFGSALEVDEKVLSLDGTDNKNNLGANAVLAVSMASHRAFAASEGLELFEYLRNLYFNNLNKNYTFPRLMSNVINGGVHADSGLSIQEFMIVSNLDNYLMNLQATSEIYQTLKKILKSKKMVTAVGDEGGFAPQIKTPEEVFEILLLAISQAGYENKVDLAIDVAASEFYERNLNEEKNESFSGKYLLQGQALSVEEMVEKYSNWVNTYPLISIEDMFQEDDLKAWELASKELKHRTQLVGDDLFVTNPKRLQEIGINEGVANSILIKLNQIGSVKETCETINLALENGFVPVISHRSGETEDSFISDLSISCNAKFIKTGATCRSERISKYNRLIEINQALNSK